MSASSSPPSSSRSRRRAGNDVWPEPFLEDLALIVATDASRSLGRLAAAQALALIFQVTPFIKSIYYILCLFEVLVRFAYYSSTCDGILLLHLWWNSTGVRLR